MPKGQTAEKTKNGARPDVSGEDKKYLDRYGKKLSATTQRAKWISSPQDHAERKGQTLATRNPEVIRRWAEEREAQPAVATRGDDGSPHVLRFDFPGYGGKSLEKVEWDEWLETFGERNLVFVYQEQLRNGNQSNFFRLENPDREDA